MKKSSQVLVLDVQQYSTLFAPSRKEPLLWWYSLNAFGKKKAIKLFTRGAENNPTQLEDTLTFFINNHSIEE